MPGTRSRRSRRPRGGRLAPALSLLATNASCCSVPEMFMVAYEPETDFTLAAVAEGNIGGGLKLGEAVGGACVFMPGRAEHQALRLHRHPQGQPGADRDQPGPEHVLHLRDGPRHRPHLEDPGARSRWRSRRTAFRRRWSSGARPRCGPGAVEISARAGRHANQKPEPVPAFRKQISGLLRRHAGILSTRVLSLVLVAWSSRWQPTSAGGRSACCAPWAPRAVSCSDPAVRGRPAGAGGGSGLVLAAFWRLSLPQPDHPSLGVPFLLPSPLAAGLTSAACGRADRCHPGRIPAGLPDQPAGCGRSDEGVRCMITLQEVTKTYSSGQENAVKPCAG